VPVFFVWLLAGWLMRWHGRLIASAGMGECWLRCNFSFLAIWLLPSIELQPEILAIAGIMTFQEII
jgi:hypothetical protein